jgi:hypothetical protein
VIDGCDAHHRFARLADQKTIAGRGFLYQAGEVGFGFMHVDLAHRTATICLILVD